MKTSFTALSVLLLGASMALGAANPAPTPHRHLKRQQFPDGIDISAMLADPSSYLSGVSSALSNDKDAQKYAGLWASATNDPSFQQSISSALVDQFGTKTAKVALAQYSSVVGGSTGSSSGAADAGAAGAASTPLSGAAVNNADASSGSNAQQAQQVSNAVTSGAAGLASPMGLAGVALAAVPAVLLAVL